MQVDNIIKLLRNSIFIQDPDIAPVDEDLLAMKDEDFIPVLQMCLANVDPNATLDDIEDDRVYPMIILAKIELYSRLAVKTAPKYSLTSATGVQLKRAEVFDHYYKLIEQCQNDYKIYKSTGGRTLTNEEVITHVVLDNRYFSQRNYNLANNPKVTLKIDTVYADKIEVSWGKIKVNKFARFELYLDKKPIYDKYTSKVSPSATKLAVIKDIHQKCCRIESLDQDTKYYLLILIEERNGLKGYSEVEFTTLNPEVTPHIGGN